MRLKRLLSADLPTPCFLAASEIAELSVDSKSASTASIDTIYVKISRVHDGVSRARRLCEWCVCARGGEDFYPKSLACDLFYY